MYIEIKKGSKTQRVKQRFLQNFLDRGWKQVKTRTYTGPVKEIPAVVEATAEIKPNEESPEDSQDEIEQGE